MSARAPEMRYWSPEELRTFLDQIATERIFPAIHLAAMTGMRRGEVFGLLWRDVDLETLDGWYKREFAWARRPLAEAGLTP